MRKVFLTLTLLLLTASAVWARPTGCFNMKVAVICYNPFMTNVTELSGARRLNAVFGWPNGQSMANSQKSWWQEASDGMVNVDFVVITNLNIFPLMTNKQRYSQQTYYNYRVKGTDYINANFDYQHFFTNDVPWLVPAIEAGRIDQVWLYGWPGMNTYETRMFGKGALGCNSGGSYAPGNERMFMMCMPSIERSDTPMENFGHGCEWILGGWFYNSTYSYPNAINHTNISDLALYRVHSTESSENICVGDVHNAPNSSSDYDWGNTTPVLSYADCWYDYPNMTNWVPRTMTCADWGGGINYKHKIWFLNHMPRRVGLRRGHMMNWHTKYLNVNKAAYPIGSDTPISQRDVDMAGFFAFEANIPEDATQVVFRVEAGLPVQAALRKTYIPFFNRYAQSGMVVDTLADRAASHVFTLTKDNNFGKGLAGTWYVSFGNAYGAAPYNRPTNANTSYKVSVEILPKPKIASGDEFIEFTQPLEGDTLKNVTETLKWETKEPPEGWRAIYLALSTNDFEGPFETFCEDYYYELESPYKWITFPYKSKTDRARLRIIAEDRHGNTITNYSGLFGISTAPIPEPAAALALLLAALLFKKR